jgi:hypothetical protein
MQIKTIPLSNEVLMENRCTGRSRSMNRHIIKQYLVYMEACVSKLDSEYTRFVSVVDNRCDFVSIPIDPSSVINRCCMFVDEEVTSNDIEQTNPFTEILKWYELLQLDGRCESIATIFLLHYLAVCTETFCSDLMRDDSGAILRHLTSLSISKAKALFPDSEQLNEEFDDKGVYYMLHSESTGLIRELERHWISVLDLLLVIVYAEDIGHVISYVDDNGLLQLLGYIHLTRCATPDTYYDMLSDPLKEDAIKSRLVQCISKKSSILFENIVVIAQQSGITIEMKVERDDAATTALRKFKAYCRLKNFIMYSTNWLKVRIVN